MKLLKLLLTKKNLIKIAILLIAFFCIFIICNKAFGEGIDTYKDTYIIFGDKENQCKFVSSFRYALIYPFETGLFFSYSVLAHWNIYDSSSPFYELNHNPNIHWEIKDLWILDYLRISPFDHTSNGRDGAENRSIDAGFIQFQSSYNKIVNIGINEKYTYFYRLANQNADYRRYKGNFQTELFIQLKGNRKIFDQEKIYTKFEWTVKSWWVESGLMIRILTPKIRPKIYIQNYVGTGEFLQEYNKKTNAWRVGLIFNPE